jgi:hypothetical protein
MKLKTLFVALVAVCIAVALAAAQPSAAGSGKGKGNAKASAGAAKKGHSKANGHQSSGGHKAGKGHSDDADAAQAAPEQSATEDPEGAGGAEADVAAGEEPKNAAHECKSERDELGEEAFASTYGKNENKRNAFGKCVSQKAHERNGGGEEAATEAGAEEAATESTEGAPAGTTADGEADAIQTESPLPDGADAHERQHDQLAELIRRLEELLADLKAQLAGGSAPAPATP